MSGEEETETIELEGAPGEPYEAAVFRIGLAMALTMVADIAEQHGDMPAGAMHGLATNLIELNDNGKSFIAAHVAKMAIVKITPADPEAEDEEG
jgi:hypothetical protein